jgi:hypothetical protein
MSMPAATPLVQVVDDLPGDDLARGDDGSAGRVGADRLRRDASHGLVGRDVLGARDGGVAGQHGLFELQRPGFGQAHCGLLLQGVGVLDETLQGLEEEDLGSVVVSVGDPGADPAGVAGADVDVAMGAEPLGGLHAVDAQRRVHGCCCSA